VQRGRSDEQNMPMLLRRRYDPLAGDHGSPIQTDRDRREARASISKALRRLADAAQRPGVTVHDIQLLVQVCAPPSWPQWRAEREQAFRRKGQPYSALGWPEELKHGQYAAALLPVSAGRVGLAVAKHPSLVASPYVAIGAPADGQLDDLPLGVVARWVSNPAEGQSARLAPPVIEVIQRGRVIERRVETFGTDAWSLPVADDV
jgi:hypothetical protein